MVFVARPLTRSPARSRTAIPRGDGSIV